MKKLIFLWFVLIGITTIAQTSINNYKYVVVDKNFSFLKKSDQYQTSSLTKFLFNKNGFKAYLNSDKLPDEINNNRCGVLFADVEKKSSFLRTKVVVVLKDCNNTVVFKSKEGVSKEKDFKKAYHEAIRRAFEDATLKNYSYQPKQKKVEVKDVKKPIKEEKALLKITKPIVVKNEVKVEAHKSLEILYAQGIDNGFQLVDTTPKVIFQVLKTARKDVFVIKNKTGILYKKGASWFAEYYKDNKLIVKEFQIKF